jgi:antitoxin ParD1/3/4/toxin ParE1/3/4
MRPVTFRPEARADLDAIWDYLAAQDLDAAPRVEALLAACDRLAVQPHLGHPRPDLTARPFLFWRRRPYHIVYRADRTPIEIVAIVHMSRDVETVLAERAE